MSDQESLCSSEEGSFPLHGSYVRNWNTIPSVLSEIQEIFADEHHVDPLMQIPDDKLFTMDGVSKCWKCVPHGSESLLLQEPDGITLAICEQCVAQIPMEIQHALYFFHSLLCHIQDYALFAVESENVLLKHERKKGKSVRKLLWSRTEKVSSVFSDMSELDDLDMNTVMQDRSTNQDGNIISEISPLKIRVGFTNVSFIKDGVPHKRVFCILYVTFARNFDAYEYIKEVFLKEPTQQETNYQRKHSVFVEMSLLWKRLIRFVAFDNLCLDESVVGKPERYSDDPGGILGIYSLMNIFQIPFQIYGSVKASFKVEIHDRVILNEFKIGGFPHLTFKNDEIMKDYVNYMHSHVNIIMKAQEQLAQAIRKSIAKSGKKSKDVEEEEEEVCEKLQLFCIGSWPLHHDGQRFDVWGLPPIPVYMNFEPEFSPDVYANFSFWVVEAGGPSGIPELVKACLRFYLVSGSAPVDTMDGHINWDHFLSDSRIANPSLVLQKYYSEKADPMSALVVAGYLRTWWTSLVREFKCERVDGVSVLVIFAKLQRYLDSIILHHQSSVHCNAFRSDRISQAMQIIDKLPFESITKVGDQSILHALKQTRDKLDFCRQHDSYQVTNELFWRTWEDLNHSFKMNSSNLSFLVEMMTSQIFWMMGEHNETWAAYFQGIQIKSGNGHYRISTKEGIMDDQRKPNSSGMDWTHARLTQLFQIILDRFGCSDARHNLQTPVNCMSWTPASVPLLTNATICDGKIDTLPDTMISLRSVIATEVRNADMNPMIGNFPRNAEGTEQLRMNTCDPDNSNKRRSRLQVKVAPLHIVAFSTNCAAHNDKENEQFRTLGAVMQIMVPGSGPHNKRQRVGDFNNQTCNAFGGRHSKPENMDVIANILSYSNIWVTCLGALINKSAALPWEINPAVLSYLDWIFFYVREHLDGILDRFVLQSFRRMKEGYESRQVAKSVWTNAIRDLATCDNKHQAISQNLLNLHVHALSMTEVPAAVHSFLCRGIHMGSCLMVVACSKHLQVPIVPLHFLCDILNGQFDTPTHRKWMTSIQTWLKYGVDNHRFCYDESEHRTCYITSDCDSAGNPLNDKICMLRVKKQRVQNDNVAHAIGVRVKDLYGSELLETCHMGPEPSIYGNAIQTLLHDWSPDFRQMYGNNLYASAKHVSNLQLGHLFPGISDWIDDEPPAFVKIFTYKTQTDKDDSVCFGMGVNVWGLLLMTSLGATTFHPHVVSDISRTLITDILNKSPMCATPGNTSLVRSFNLVTTGPERIKTRATGRPLHFPRPVDDLSFATTGVFTYARNVDKYMPEDVMHCGFLFSLAKVLHCDILAIPGRVVPSEYEIMSMTHYAVWNCVTEHSGTLIVDHSVRKVSVYVHDTSVAWQWEYDEWMAKLKEQDFVILPMIFRSGACIKLDSGAVGLIVPWAGTGVNYGVEDGMYLYVTGESAAPVEIKAIHTLQRLIAVGTEMYLDLDSESGTPLQVQRPREEEHMRYLVVRLNTPTVMQPDVNKMYVTFLQKQVTAHAKSSIFNSKTIAVNVSEVLMSLPVGEDFIAAMVVGL